LLIVSFLIWPSQQPQLATDEEARNQAVSWLGQLDDAAWKNSTPPQAFILPAQLRSRPGSWQSLPPGSNSPQVVCYDVSIGTAKAYLFVAFSGRVTSLPNRPPANTYPTKGSWHIAAWKTPIKNGELVYVLAVESGGRQYQDLIGRPSSIASRPVGRKSSLVGKV
jgi:hypothetical protein